jgi:hypothetical protein
MPWLRVGVADRGDVLVVVIGTSWLGVELGYGLL